MPLETNDLQDRATLAGAGRSGRPWPELAWFVPNATVDKAVDYIKRCQNPDGGFSYRLVDADESAFPRSAAAIVALYSAGVYGGEEIRRGLI